MKHFIEFYEKNQCNQMMAFLGFNFNNSKCYNKQSVITSINNLTAHLKTLDKQEEIMYIKSRWEEIKTG